MLAPLHVGSLASIDLFVVPTVTFQVLYVLVILRHDRRRVVHCNVTVHPTAAWVSRQILQAFPFEEVPRYLLRNRDAVYGEELRRTLRNLRIEEVNTGTTKSLAESVLRKADRLHPAAGERKVVAQPMVGGLHHRYRWVA